MVKKAIQHIRDWYKHNFSWKGVLAISWLLAKEIPSMFSREKFWSTNLPVAWKFIYAHSTMITVLVVGLIIWLDHRRVMRRHAQRYDLNTLKGRTLKFCDDLEAFKLELGEEPQIIWKTGNTAGEFSEANEATIIREQKMHHGFHLRFAETAWKLWHEHGADRREAHDLENELRGRIDCDERLNPIIKRFRELAEMEEPMEGAFR